MPNLDSLFENFLETAASIAVLFFIISWIASKAVEICQAALNEHGERLYQELARCFGEGDEAEKAFTDAFYQHSLVKPLLQPQGRIRGWIQRVARRVLRRKCNQAKRLPAYIAPETFAAVMLDLFPPTGGREAESAASRPLNEGMATLQRQSEGDSDEYRASVANWYREAMDRATGRFKRSAVFGMVAAAGILCLVFNINAIRILTELLTNEELRASGFRTAEYYRDRPDELRTLNARLEFMRKYTEDDRCGLPEAAATGNRGEAGLADRNAAAATPDRNCLNALLPTLWRDPQRPNLIRSLEFDERAGDWKRTHVETVLNYCDAEARTVMVGASTQRVNFCPENLVAAATRCAPREDPAEASLDRAESASPRNAAPPPPPAPAPEEAAAPPRAGDGTTEVTACQAAWRQIWTTPTFFWDTTAATMLANYLDPEADPTRARPQPAQLHSRLDTLSDQARTGAQRLGGFFSALPGVGYFWQEWEWSGAELLYSLAGILLSALLAAFGAPFWYDLLSKVSRRGARGPSPSER